MTERVYYALAGNISFKDRAARTRGAEITMSRVHLMAYGGCSICDKYCDGDMMPPHDASPRCESGKRNHCSCDVCF